MTDAFYVYAYFRLDGSPCYVGKGKGERWRHRGNYGRNVHFVRIHAQAKRLGQALPCEKLVDGLSDQEALDLEAFFIAAIGREVDGGSLVNLSIGGERGPVGYKWTAEQREAHGAIRRGRKRSPEWCAAISASLKGKPKSAKHAVAAGAAQRGGTKASGWWSTEEGRAKQKANNHGRRNKLHSEATKEKIRAARALQTNMGVRSKDYQPSAETRAKLSAAANSRWVAYRAETIRNKVVISNSWAAQNSCRYQVSAA